MVLTTGCDSQRVDFITLGVGLPPNSKIVHVLQESGFQQDARSYLVFDTDRAGIEQFALAYSGGVPISQFQKDRDKIGNYADVDPGVPWWELRPIQNGRYFKHKLEDLQSFGFLSIDLDKNRVYMFR